MYGYNSVGRMNDNSIKVEIEENMPMEAVFSKEGIKVGNMIIKKPTKNKEYLIRVVIKD